MVIQKEEEGKLHEEEEEERKAWHRTEKKTEHPRIPFHEVLGR